MSETTSIVVGDDVLTINAVSGRWEVAPGLLPVASLAETQAISNAVSDAPSSVLLSVQLTRRCNIACSYCYQNSNPSLPSSLISEADMALALDLGFESSVDSWYLNFHGGEPLLGIERIRQAFAHPLSSQIRFAIQSNGTLVTESIARELAEHKVSVSLSLDGSQAIHDEGRMGWRATMRGYERLRSVGMNSIGLGATFTSSTVHAARDTIRLFGALGCTRFSLSPTMQAGAASAEMMLSTEQYVQLFLDSLDELAIQFENGVFLFERELCTLLRHLCSDVRTYMCKASPCGAGRLMFAVRADGHVFPCDHYLDLPDFDLGHLGQPLDVLRASARRFTEFSRLRAECQSCPFRNVCYGGCAAENRFSSGRYGPNGSWQSCARAEVLKALAVKVATDDRCEAYAQAVLDDLERELA